MAVTATGTGGLSVAFAGTPEFAAQALDAILKAGYAVPLVLTQPDRPAGRGMKLSPSAVKQLALAHGIEVDQPEKLRTDAQRARLADCAPDVLVVAAYGLILPKAVLELPRLGCINIHASLLPRWRGAAPIQRAIQAGDRQTGVTIMRMDAGLDTGPMLLVKTCPISDRDTAASVHDRLAVLGAEALLEALPGVADGSLAAQPQDESGACYAQKLDKAEALIDWTRPAIEIDRLVRAFIPWPVAQTELDGKPLRIWRCSVQPGIGGAAQPGCVVAADQRGIDVVTGNAVLRIHELQPPGKRVMSAAEFLNARSLLGVCFG